MNKNKMGIETETNPTAAVAVIYTKSIAFEKQFLVLKRTQNQNDPWSGHLSFPGGKKEESDKSLFECCLRETYEECGIKLSEKDLVKEWKVHFAGSHLGHPIAVQPFVFELEEKPMIELNRSEFEDFFWVDKSLITNPIYQKEKSFHREGPYSTRLFPYIEIEGHALWGFSYHLLRDLWGGQA